MILGFFLALMPGFFLSIFIFLVAIWAFISGIGMLVQNRGPQHLTSRTVVGILLIAFGLFAGISPGHTADALVLVFAVMIIIFGGYLLNRSSEMHKTEKKIAEEVLKGGGFRRQGIFNFTIKWLAPVFAIIILISSVASAFGWIHI